MAKRPLLSFHPRLSAVLEALFSLLFFFVLHRLGDFWLVVIGCMVRVLWWGFLTRFTFYPKFVNSISHLVSLIVFGFGSTALLVFTDSGYSWYVVALCSLLLSMGSFWFIPPQEQLLTTLAKPQRRLRWLMAIVGVAGLWCGAFGFSIFQTVSGLNELLLFLFAVFATGIISLWWWYEYEKNNDRTSMFISAGVLALIVAQIGYVLFLWPFGYLVDAFLITWIWYHVWMLFRFSMSKEGIDWDRHRWSLGFQSVLLIIFLVFIARWR